MFERMFRPCGMMISARRVHAGSSRMPKETETPQAGDAPAGSCLAALCPGSGGKLGKLPTSFWVGGRADPSFGALALDGALTPGKQGMTLACNAVAVPACTSLVVTSVCPGGDLGGGRGQPGSESSELLSSPGQGRGWVHDCSHPMGHPTRSPTHLYPSFCPSPP